MSEYSASELWSIFVMQGFAGLSLFSVLLLMALGLGLTGVALAGGGIYVGETDDAPGAALLGLLLMTGRWSSR